LNIVERFFCNIATEYLCHSIFTNVSEFTVVIYECVLHHNENFKPFIWIAQANDILQKIVRASS